MSDPRWIRVAAEADCLPGALLAVKAEDTGIVLANVEGTLYALQDRCSHANFPLSDGELEGTRLECMYHGAGFDVCDGRALSMPAIRPVPVYEVELRDGDIFVALT